MSTLCVVAYIESGQAVGILKDLVLQACQQQSILPPVLPLEHEDVCYRLYMPAAEGDLLSKLVIAGACIPSCKHWNNT